jgi:hypothetical protein
VEAFKMQCDIQFQGSKETMKVDLSFVKSDNSPIQVSYRGKTGFLKSKSREVFKDNNMVVLWFKVIKSAEPLPE